MAAVALLISASSLVAQGQAMPGREPGDAAGTTGQGMQMGMGQGMMGGMMQMMQQMHEMMQMMGQGMSGAGMMGPGMMGMMDRGMGMMATGGPGPATILGMGDALALDEDQKTRLEAIEADYRSTVQPLMSQAMEAQGRAASALDGDPPDFDAYEDALHAATDPMIEAHAAMARAAFEAREVLTEEQRDKLAGGMQSMQGMMGAGQGGGAGMMRQSGPMAPAGGR